MQILFQKKSLILSIIFFIFSCFTFLFFYRSINNNEKISQLAQEEWQTEVARRENTRSLINLIKTIGPERTLLEKHFVKGSDIVPFLDTIEKLAGEIRAKTEIISVNTAKDNSSLAVEVKTSGSFETIYKFVLLLENSPYNLEFISANIQNSNAQNVSASKNNKIQQWTATFKIKLLNFIN